MHPITSASTEIFLKLPPTTSRVDDWRKHKFKLKVIIAEKF